MTPTRQHAANQSALVRFMGIANIGMLALSLALVYGWSQAPKKLTLRYPPDLRVGKVMGVDDVPHENVYSWTWYVIQQLNRWQTDGVSDGPRAIANLSAFFHPQFRKELEKELDDKAREGELRNRTRYAVPMPSSKYTADMVKEVAPGTWNVTVDMQIVDVMDGRIIKDVPTQYSVVVRLYDIDPEINPWGFVIDKWKDSPRKLDEPIKH